MTPKIAVPLNYLFLTMWDCRVSVRAHFNFTSIRDTTKFANNILCSVFEIKHTTVIKIGTKKGTYLLF